MTLGEPGEGFAGPGPPTRVFHVAVACDRDPASTGFAVRRRRTAGVEDIKGRAGQSL